MRKSQCPSLPMTKKIPKPKPQIKASKPTLGISDLGHFLVIVFWSLVILSAFPLSAQTAYKKPVSVGEPPADHSPEAELASFKVLDGFQVNLFASEKDGVPNPLVLRWDERGRLWVLSTTAYPQPEPDEVCNDQVLILEDTDHDGRMDKRTVYAEGLRMPMGMELAGPGELYLGEGEKLWLLKDTNGDDRADEKEVVFSGFGTGDTHQNLNSFIWSPDGALVMHQGLHCYSRVTTAWGVKQLYGAGFWRFWPRSRKLEAYPTGMPLNPWGTAFTKEGQPIMVAGAAGMFWARPMEIAVPELPQSHATPSANKGSEGLPYFLLSRFMLPHSGQIIKTAGLRKFCGVDIPWNSHWPNRMADEIVTGGFFENAVYRHERRPDAVSPSGFEAVEQEPLITSSNVAFRPVDVRFGPEGALYVADWYDPIIGHYQASFRHPNRDKVHGRIWRVTCKDSPLVSWKELYGNLADKPTLSLLTQMTDQSDRWQRYQAQRLLLHRPVKEVVEAARQLWSECTHHGFRGNEPHERHVKLSAIQAFASMGAVDTSWLNDALSNESDWSRAAAVHVVGTYAEQLPDPLSLLSKRIVDTEPRVRLEAIVACAKVQSPEAIKVALKALDAPMDTFLDRALWLAVHATAPQWKKPETLDAFLSSLPPKHLAYLVEKEGSVELLAAVRGMVEKLPTETQRAVLISLVRQGEAADVLRALKLGMKDAAILNTLASEVSMKPGKAPDEALSMLTELLEKGTKPQKIAACHLAGAWRMRSADVLIRRLLKEWPASEDTRAPLAALARLGEPVETFQTYLRDSQQPWPVRITALTAMVDTKPALAGQEAAKLFAGIPDAEVMRLLLIPLLSREAAMNALAKALDASPCSADTAKLALTTLTAAGRSDAALTAVLNKIIGVKNTLPAYSVEWVNELAAEVKAKGDAAKGKTVFAAPLSGCIACHQIGRVGGIIGPELDSVGRGVPVELLIEAVVWPQRQIKEGYVATSLALKDGRKLQGYKISESAAEVQLKDMLTGTTSTFSRSDIASRQESGSLMPEGLILNMTREELRDLIAYLAGLGR